jgi:hypothetical protein
MRKVAACLFVCVAVTFPCSSFAWNDYGHRLIGAFAWGSLSPTEQAKVRKLLTYFREDDEFVWPQNRRMLVRTGLTDPTLEDASTHPDNIRDFQIADPFGPWHYTDLRFYQDTPAKDRLACPNVVERLETVRGIFGTRRTRPQDLEKRAQALVWLCHVLEDIHQPLHSATYYSGPFVQTGDRGGNLFLVRYLKMPDDNQETRSNLHSFWDSLLELDGQRLRVSRPQQIAQLRAAFPRTAFSAELQVADPYQWAKASKGLGEQSAYYRLRAFDQQAANENQRVQLDEEYVRAASAVARRQAALAGYRLADLIKWGVQDLPNP